MVKFFESVAGGKVALGLEYCLAYLVKMKKLVIIKYKSGRADAERWGVSMNFDQWSTCIDDHLASFDAKLNPFPDDEELGSSAEQAIAAMLNVYNTAKISKDSMANWEEAKVLEYCSKNFVKIAAESKSTAEKISAAVETASSWFVEKAIEMGGLFVAGKDAEALAIQAEIEARKLNPPTS
jgi:hypothetical protein